MKLKKRFGGAIATQILADKQNMEKSKAKGDSTVYFMEHPEARGQEDSQFQKNQWCLKIRIRIFNDKIQLKWWSYFPKTVYI